MTTELTGHRTGLRFSLVSTEQLRSIAAAPLPLNLRAVSTATSFHRDLYFDTPEGALQARDVVCRLRYSADGRSVLSIRLPPVTLPGRTSSDIIAAELVPMSAGEALSGNSEPMRRLRAFTDVGSLEQQVELETARVIRLSRAGWLRQGRVEFILDDVTIRHRDLVRSFQELKISRHGMGGPTLLRVADAVIQAYAIRTSLATKLERAQAISRRLEADEVTFHIGIGRSVVLVAIDEGSIALVKAGSQFRFPAGPGAGEAACRNAMQTWFGSRVGELHLAGTAQTPARDRSVEVWIIRRIRRVIGQSAPSDIGWNPLDSVKELTASGAITDPESLVAYRMVADSGLTAPSATIRGLRSDPGRIEPPIEPTDNFLNGPASELAFIERVLALAEDDRVPLLERIRYVSIVSANLDEFYMGSAGSLRQSAEGDEGMQEQVRRLSTQTDHLLIRQRTVVDSLLASLAQQGHRLRSWGDLTESERTPLVRYFREEILPLLTPRAITVSPGHPFPVIPPLTLAFTVALREGTGSAHYAYLKIPGEVPRFVEAGQDFLPVEELIRAHLNLIYPDREIGGAWLFRITRVSDLDVDDARAGNLLQAMEEDLDRRRKNPLVRLETESTMPGNVLDLIERELRLEGRGGPTGNSVPEIQRVPGILALGDLRQLAELEIPGGSFPPAPPRRHFREDQSIWDQIRAGDHLVHHPFDGFAETVVRFFAEAAEDPAVVSIRLTLYRAGDRSPLVEALERAARAGQEVTVFVELKARFDEARNIFWVKRLEAAGVQVIYGLVGLKNHSKVALVVRRESEGLRRYVHIGTGNYNPGTARVYTDLGLFSADRALGEDVHDLFNQLTGTSGPPESEFRRILVAPARLLPALLERIEREIDHVRSGRPGLIRAKINGLADPEIVRVLYRASEAGVDIDLMVRGICLLRPGVEGLSSRVRVQSILGRFLEHARIYHFGNGGEDEYFIASADWRPRNLRRRVEVAVPIFSASCRSYLDRILSLELNDPTAWVLQADGSYAKPVSAVGDPSSVQRILQEGRPV
ncbi:MAG: polyphosphate kinase 1 [Gemmatimonadota bacterium]